MSGVFVGVDESKEAAAALRWAVRYAETAHMPISVITVLDPLTFTALWTDRPADSVPEAYVDATRGAIADLIARLESDQGRDISVPVDIRVEIGHPVRTLVAAAAEADLLVVGACGTSAVASLLLGSVSAGVSRHAHCSVAIIRARPVQHGGAPDLDPR